MMEIRMWLLSGKLEISVEVVDGEEETLVFAFVAAEDFNHPVNHLSS